MLEKRLRSGTGQLGLVHLVIEVVQLFIAFALIDIWFLMLHSLGLGCGIFLPMSCISVKLGELCLEAGL